MKIDTTKIIAFPDLPRPHEQIGNQFVAVGNLHGSYAIGDILTLAYNDDTSIPLFTNKSSTSNQKFYTYWYELGALPAEYTTHENHENNMLLSSNYIINELQECIASHQTSDKQCFEYIIKDNNGILKIDMNTISALPNKSHPDFQNGKKFISIHDGALYKTGDVLTLINNDLTRVPRFRNESTNDDVVYAYWCNLGDASIIIDNWVQSNINCD